MKKMTNINVARINATRNLFASLPIEFTTQQFEDARRAEALANAVAASNEHNPIITEARAIAVTMPYAYR